MSNNVSELAIIRKGILKELFLPRSAFLRGRNSVLGFCAWTIRISCYRSWERATEHIIRDILALNIFCWSKRGDKKYFEGCCFMTASPLYMQQLWWCPPQWWWLVVQGTWIFRIFGSSPGLVKHLLSLPLLVLESQRYSKQTMWKYVFQICDQVSFSQLLIWSKLTFSLKCISQSWSEKST